MDRTNNRRGIFRCRKRKGVSAVEFAFVAPVFFLFVFGMVEFGRIVMIQQCMTNASRAGCRTAALATTTTDAQVKASVQEFLNTAIADSSDVKVNITPNDLSTTSSGTQVTVSVQVAYSDISWLSMGKFNPTINATSALQRE